MGMRLKRHRGGQPGNQNARRHGFYSLYMSQPEIRQLEKIIAAEGIEKTVAIYRIKLSSALCHAPGNTRIIRETAALLAKWYCSRHRLGSEDKTLVKKLIQSALETQVNCRTESCLEDVNSPLNAGTNEAESTENTPRSQNELKLKINGNY
jgi:hypothetical protein